MQETPLDDLNAGDKVRVIFRPDRWGVVSYAEGEFRAWAVSKKVRAISLVWHNAIPGTTGKSTTLIATKEIDKVFRLGR